MTEYARSVPGADFAHGALIEVCEHLDGDRRRIAWQSGKSRVGMIVHRSLLVPVAGARNTDPYTSHEAAAKVNREDGQAIALRLLTEAGADGLTDFELAERSGLKQTSIGKRRGELRDAGLVADTGRRRASDTGTAAIVWAAV